MLHDEMVSDEAARWAVRTGELDFADWDGFTRWLEASPDHAKAYDRVSAAVADASTALATDQGQMIQEEPAKPLAANDDEPVEHGRTRRWLGGAVAASLAAITLFGLWQLNDGAHVLETAPGEMRTFALADGGHVTLAGGSRLLLDQDEPRVVELEYGRALFTIRHKDTAPFRVHAGGNELLDVGTVFDVRHDAAGFSVAVAEGAVIFNPDEQALRLDPGDKLVSAAGSDIYAVRSIAPEAVAEWREARLTFESATLAEVAAELTGATGLSFAPGEGDTAARLTGSILVAPVREDPRMLAPLLGVTVRSAGDTWVIDSR